MKLHCHYCGAPTRGRNRVCDSLVCRERMLEDWRNTRIAIPHGFYTAAQFAKKAGLTRQAILQRCRKGKYPGTFQDSKSGRWYIPIEYLKKE